MGDGLAGWSVLTRREAGKLLAAGAALAASPSLGMRLDEETRMPITCFIRYEIDPFQREAFGQYAAAWGKIIPRCGGDLLGYFLPHEGTNDVAYGLICCDSLARYELYRARLRSDPESQANLAFARDHRLILREERTFLENVSGTVGVRRYETSEVRGRDFSPGSEPGLVQLASSAK